MGEVTISAGLEAIGHIRESEGGCVAIAVVDGRDLQLGRFANRADAAAAIRAARRAETGVSPTPVLAGRNA